MNMELITSAASDALVNVVLAIIALAGAYGVYYIRLGAAKLKEQTAQIKEMKALRDTGAITAPQDGIVASIVTPSATEQAIDTVLVSLYVGDEKEMVVSVDELDITSVEVGQNVELAMDAITDHTYAGTVSRHQRRHRVQRNPHH